VTLDLYVCNFSRDNRAAAEDAHARLLAAFAPDATSGGAAPGHDRGRDSYQVALNRPLICKSDVSGLRSFL
jgi:hypothetical protein